ncbi:hypothetical protein INR49_021621 [Caranx melampygus]|nr:hypothetical protein INR49_021621 [Caranx melampygus]
MSTVPVVVQMPDLVSSPSQVPIESPAVTQASAPSAAPAVVSAQPMTLVTATPVVVSTPAPVSVASCPGPVIVQMPDLVSTTSPIAAQTTPPVSALVTTPAQAQAKVEHSIPVQPLFPSVSPVVVPAQTAQVTAPASASTTIIKKKVPPPPPPRSTSPKPVTEMKATDTVEISLADTPPPPIILPKTMPPVLTAVTLATATVAQVSVTTTGPSQTTKPPPPIPPKPISIPAGLVFSHKPGESVKPPPPPVAPKAATLPRTKEPPNALSLSLTRPVESKLGTTSPKSPLSPRHAKCLQTYVVITLPSEPGSPTEGITVQAPVRRGSIPSTKVSGVRTTASEQKTPTEAFSAQSTVRRASVPTVRHPPPIPAPSTVAIEQVTAPEVSAPKTQTRRDSVPSEVQQPPSMADVITVPSDQRPSIPAEVITVPPEVLSEAPATQAPISTVHAQPKPLSEVVVVPLQPVVPLDAAVLRDRPATVPSTILYPQAATQIEMLEKEQEMPTDVIVTEAVITSVIPRMNEQSYVQEQLVKEYETPKQVVTTEAFAASRRESITMQQTFPLAQVVSMPAEKDIPANGYGVQVPYRRGSIPSTEQRPQVLTYSSEYDQPLEIITTEAYTRRTSMPTAQDITQGVSVAPVTITKIQQESIESQEIRGPEKVVSSMSHMYSSSISTSGQPPESLPSLVTQVVTTEVQRTTVSVVHERLPQVPPPSVAITIQPDVAKVQPLPKQNGKIIYPGDVIDLRTMKVGVRMTEQGMDLTPPESCRQSFSSDSSGRQITAVQPEIVNLSAEITPATTLSVVTDSITIVTCTATIASYNKTPAEKPLDLQGPVTSLPLPLTTCKPFEPLAQIVYRPVNSQPIVSAVGTTAQDIPMNLSFGALVSSGVKQPPAAISNGGPVLSLEATEAMDLSNYRPVRAMVALSSTSPGVVTTVVEDDGTPVDLTAGRRSVCCDVIYKLPFTGSCRTQPPVTTQPDNRFGYRDDHYQYDNAGIYGIKGMNGIKASMSETNLTEAGLFSYDSKNDYDYLSGSSDGAIDLTAAKLSADACVCLRVLPQYFGFASC